MSKANREYNDIVFRDLFSTDTRALDLYNALTDSQFTIGDGLRFTTLEKAFSHVGHNEKILERCESLRGYAVFWAGFVKI